MKHVVVKSIRNIKEQCSILDSGKDIVARRPYPSRLPWEMPSSFEREEPQLRMLLKRSLTFKTPIPRNVLSHICG